MGNVQSSSVGNFKLDNVVGRGVNNAVKRVELDPRTGKALSPPAKIDVLTRPNDPAELKKLSDEFAKEATKPQNSPSLKKFYTDNPNGQVWKETVGDQVTWVYKRDDGVAVSYPESVVKNSDGTQTIGRYPDFNNVRRPVPNSDPVTYETYDAVVHDMQVPGLPYNRNKDTAVYRREWYLQTYRSNALSPGMTREQRDALLTDEEKRGLNSLFDRRWSGEGVNWHHHQDFERMQAVPQDLHQDFKHLGGIALHR